MINTINRLYIGKSKRIHYAIALIPLAFSVALAVLSELSILEEIPLYLSMILVVIGASVTASIAFYPKFAISSMLEKLELSMPHLILRLRTMIMAGEPPLQTFMATVKEFKSPILDYVVKSIILGATPEEAVEQLEEMLGKKPVLDRLKRIVLSLGMGEQAVKFLKDEFEAVMDERESSLRKAIESLSVVVEMYMSAGVFFPVIAIVLLSSLSMLGSGGIDVNIVLTLMIFVVIPLFSAFAALIAKKTVERALI